MTLTVTHKKVTGGPVNPAVSVDLHDWDNTHTVTGGIPSDVGLGNVPNVDATNADNISGGSQLGTGAMVRATATASGLTAGHVTTNANLTGLVTSVGNATSLVLGQITNSLGADVALNNVSNYFDGPSVAQGTTGTWFASGTVTLTDSSAGPSFLVKLWDGTTVIASAFLGPNGTGVTHPVSLSGFLAAPAGNIRISVRDSSSTTGVIKFNTSGNSKDSTITAYRIA